MTTKTTRSAQSKTTTVRKVAPDKQTAGIGKGTPGPGRPKGSVNRENKMLREMILEALEKKGGVTYLATQADKNPKAFLSLLGRVLPLQVTGEGGGPIEGSITVTFK